MPVELTKRYRVIFTRDIDQISFPKPATIVISPSDSREVSAGFRTGVEVVITPQFTFDPHPNFRMPALLGFHGKSRKNGDLRDLFDAMDDARSDMIPAEDIPDYFTMLLDMQAYRNIIRTLGPQEGSLEQPAGRVIGPPESGQAGFPQKVAHLHRTIGLRPLPADPDIPGSSGDRKQSPTTRRSASGGTRPA